MTSKWPGRLTDRELTERGGLRSPHLNPVVNLPKIEAPKRQKGALSPRQFVARRDQDRLSRASDTLMH